MRLAQLCSFAVGRFLLLNTVTFFICEPRIIASLASQVTVKPKESTCARAGGSHLEMPCGNELSLVVVIRETIRATGALTALRTAPHSHREVRGHPFLRWSWDRCDEATLCPREASHRARRTDVSLQDHLSTWPRRRPEIALGAACLSTGRGRPGFIISHTVPGTPPSRNEQKSPHYPHCPARSPPKLCRFTLTSFPDLSMQNHHPPADPHTGRSPALTLFLYMAFINCDI